MTLLGGITSILSVFGAIDITPILALFIKNPALVPAIVAGIGILYGLLRMVTTTRPGEAGRHDDDRGFEHARMKTDQGA